MGVKVERESLTMEVYCNARNGKYLE
jgi:hypothetical protein